MFEQIILGMVQGIAEWLPISSEGMIVLVKTHFFQGTDRFTDIIKLALFLHLGTFCAAFVYFFKDVIVLIRGLFNFSKQTEETQKLTFFLILTTLISGVLGLCLIKTVEHLTLSVGSIGQILTALVGGLLLITGYLELKAHKGGHRDTTQLKISDSIILGIVQGCAALPGLSRSGLTVSTLLLRRFTKTSALKLSFLMSLPIVLAGNIVLNLNEFTISKEGLIGLGCSFIFGLLTIHILLKLAEKFNFGLFVIGFGVLTLLAAFIG